MHTAAPLQVSSPVRFGFVVSKAVGHAPRRNLVKRRLRSLAASVTARLEGDVVFRALPTAATSTWESLAHDVSTCIEKYENSRA